MPQESKGGHCDACLKKSNLNKAIGQAEETLQRLLVERYAVLTEQNLRHDYMARLPLEISGYIFGMSLPERHHSWGAFISKDDRGRMPTMLASVCKGWRDIAFSTPQLWSTIHITLSEYDPRRAAQFVQHWVDRSRSLPLSLTITLCRDYMLTNDDSEECFWDPVFHVVNECSDRWQSMSLFLPSMLLRRVCGNGRDRPKLTGIWVIGQYEGQGYRPQLEFSEPLPSPEVVTLASVRPLGLSWSNLRRASLEDLTTGECLELLQKAPYLARLSVEKLRIPSSSSPLTHVVHPAMTTLRLHNGNGASGVPIMESFINALTLPKLQKIRCDSLAPLSHGHLLALMQRSKCSLAKLKIGSYEYRMEEPESLRQLTDFPELIHLFIYGKRVTDRRFLEAVAQKTTTVNTLKVQYLPKLRRLTMTVDTLDPFPWSFVPKLIGTQGRRGTGLQNLRLIGRHPRQETESVDRALLEQIKELEKSGRLLIVDEDDYNRDFYSDFWRYHATEI